MNQALGHYRNTFVDFGRLCFKSGVSLSDEHFYDCQPKVVVLWAEIKQYHHKELINQKKQVMYLCRSVFIFILVQASLRPHPPPNSSSHSLRPSRPNEITKKRGNICFDCEWQRRRFFLALICFVRKTPLICAVRLPSIHSSIHPPSSPIVIIMSSTSLCILSRHGLPL